jgi:predicted dehydrogenase/nucleoside-diphosphate-sugar epimerase
MTTPTKPPLRAAFIGAGQMAHAHFRALERAHDHVAVHGVFDPDLAAAEALGTVAAAKPYTNLEEMFAAATPDIVHICTPAGRHYEATRAALEHGAHVYVEKPFVETLAAADALLSMAASANRLICAGHQLLGDPVFDRLAAESVRVSPYVSVESRIAFNSPTLRRDDGVERQVAQLIDILPHPMYALVALLERMAPGEAIRIASLHVSPTVVDALLVAGSIRGRLCVDLLARPVVSSMSVTGRYGTLTGDFMRGCVTGLANPGTSPVEKAANQVLDGALVAWRSGTGVVKRILGGGEYPGLVEHLDRFHTAIRTGGQSPTSPTHLRTVAELHETIATEVRRLAERSVPARTTTATTRPATFGDARPVAVLTGASGFLGRRLVGHLATRGFAVWGVGRSAHDDNPALDRWIHADVSKPIPPGAFKGASVVVHAAAATSGGFEAHQRHGIDAAENVVNAAVRDGVGRFVHVSSLSVVAPPRSLGEVQDEATPLATPTARNLGPYTWGKCIAEVRVAEIAAKANLPVRIVRPGAFFDSAAPEIAGLVGKRLFGPWHLGLGRPDHPFAAIEIDDAAAAIAWFASDFENAPEVVNLFDPALVTRADLISRLRRDKWDGKMVWVPISLLSAAATAVVSAITLRKPKNPDRTSIWQLLRPRKFDARRSATVFEAMRKAPAAEPRAESRTERGPLVAA